jgi:hypothetical protein
MKTFYSLLAIISALAIVMVASNVYHIFATRECAQCTEFKKLTSQFEKDVIKASSGSAEEIPGLLEQYNSDVLDLFPSTSH